MSLDYGIFQEWFIAEARRLLDLDETSIQSNCERYYNFLAERITTEQFVTSIDMLFALYSKFPTAKQILESAIGSKDALAADYWRMLLKAASRGLPTLLPIAVKEALDRATGGRPLEALDESKLDFVRREFMRLFPEGMTELADENRMIAAAELPKQLPSRTPDADVRPLDGTLREWEVKPILAQNSTRPGDLHSKVNNGLPHGERFDDAMQRLETGRAWGIYMAYLKPHYPSIAEAVAALCLSSDISKAKADLAKKSSLYRSLMGGSSTPESAIK